MRLLARLREAFRLPDPHNPVGGFQGTAYRLRTGSAVIVRARQGATEINRAAIAANLAPARYVAVGVEVPPRGMLRVLSLYAEERWEPVLAAVDAASGTLSAGIPTAGYRVTQHLRTEHCDCSRARFEPKEGELVHVGCGRPARSRVQGELRDHVLALHAQTNDDATYNGYYATLRGNDVAHDGDMVLRGRPLIRDGKVVHDGTIRGGTEIRGGRTEHARLLRERGHDVWDAGWLRDSDRIRAEQKAGRDATFELDTEKAHKALPRKIGEV